MYAISFDLMDLYAYIGQLKYRSDIQRKKQVWCVIRKKWLIITPEELVRQAAILYLNSKGYPLARISVERQINIHNLVKRYDIAVADRQGSILILVECKSPDVPIHQSSLDQVSLYNQHLLADILWITNGHQHRIYQIDRKKNTVEILTNLPSLR